MNVNFRVRLLFNDKWWDIKDAMRHQEQHMKSTNKTHFRGHVTIQQSEFKST